MQESLIERAWLATDISRIKVETLFGKIQIAGHDSGEIKVELSGKFYGWQFWAANRNLKSDLEFYDITLEQEGNTLVVKTALKNGMMNWLRFMGMNFRILLPSKKGFETEIRAEAGNIYVENYLGSLKIRTGAGRIYLDTVRGEVDAKTFAGKVKIRNCKADINVQTSAGTMEVRDCEGSLNLNTSGGTIELHQLVGNIYAATSAGTIEAHDINGILKVATAAGSVEVYGMKGSLGAVTNMGTIEAEILQLGDFLNVETHSGNIKVQLPVDRGMDLDIKGMQVKAPGFPQFKGEYGHSNIKGRTGNGGIPVYIKAHAGNVKVNAYQQKPFDSFEKAFKDVDFTLPTHFFRFDLKGIALSFGICVLMTYGFSGIVFFILEQITNQVMRDVYTGIVLGYLLNSFLTLILVYFFTQKYADKISSNLSKYLVLGVASFVLSIIGQIFLGLIYWQFITLPDAALASRQPMFIYLFIPSIVACIYFFFWQRSRQITRKISEQEFQLLSLEKLKTKAELDALQARINPHFLYNALNSIAGLVHEDADKAEKMTMLLSKLFRFTIGTQDQHFNTVENEMEIVRTYLEIEQVRFGKRLTYTLEVEDGLSSINIPRFLLQPVVENAIKHGVSKISGEGRIEVKVQKTNEQLRCTIHDNGPAFTDNFFTGYGLQSIQDKLKLLYGENASLDIQNNDYKQVIIQLPC